MPASFRAGRVTSSPEWTNEVQNAFWKRPLGHDETGYYLYRQADVFSSSRLVIVEKYSPAMKLMWSASIPDATGVMGDSKLYRRTEFNNGKILTFWEGWNKAQGENSWVLKELNADGTLSEEEFLLETEPAPGQMRSSTYKVSFSPDGTKMLVLTEKPYQKDSKELMRLQVFSTDTYTSIWKQNITLENESARNPDNYIVVDNNGTAHIFKDIKITNKEHNYQLITVGNGSSPVVELIDLQTFYPTYHKIQIDASGNVVVVGMLATQGSNQGIWQSVWYLKGDAAGKIVSNHVEPLGSDLLRQIVPEKQATQEGAKLQDYVLKDVLLRSDGGLVLLAEEQHDLKTIVGQSTPPVNNHEMRFGGIVALTFDAAGNRAWNTYYQKLQHENSPEDYIHYGSFAYQLKNDKLYLVWNYTELRSDPPNYFRYWVDRNGSKINIDNLFGKEALFPTLLTVINADGTLEYQDRTFGALPLEAIQKPNAFPMAIDPSLFFATEDGIVVLSRMHGVQTKRYKFNTIRF